MGRRRSQLLLLAILVIAAILRAYLFRGYIGLDDAEYARFAFRLGQEPFPPATYEGPAVFPLRIGLTVPAAIVFRLFGVTEWTMVLYPFLVSVATVCVAFACASLLFGRGAGFVAALLWAVLPIELEHATKLLPDLPAATFAAVAVTVIVFVEAKGTTFRKWLLGGVIAGFFLGASWLSKETISYLAPFFIVWLVLSIRKHGWNAVALWSGVATGAVVVLTAEAIAYAYLTGDPLFRFHEIERNYRQWPNSFFTEGSVFGWKEGLTYGQALAARLFVTGPQFILTNPSFMFVPLIAVLGSVYAWIQRDRSFLIPSLWFWTLVLMFNFASSSVTQYLPSALADRYLYSIVFPAVVLVSGFLVKTLWTSDAAAYRRLSQIVGGAAVLLLAYSGAPQLIYGLRHPPGWWLDDTRALTSSIDPATSLYADTLSLRAFEFFSVYPEKTSWTAFEEMPVGAPMAPGSRVLVNRAFLQWLDKNGGMWVSWPSPKLTERDGYRQHPFYKTPPASWKLLRRSDNAVLYRIDDSSE